MQLNDFAVYAESVEEMKLVVLADRPIKDEDTVRVADLSIEAEPDQNTTWVPATWVGEVGKTRICSVLVAGRQVPESEVPPDALRALRRGRRRIWLYLPNSPERLIRPSEGFMRVY